MLTEALGGKIRAEAGEEADRIRRITFAGSHLFGLAVARHIIKQPSVAEMDLDQLVAQVAPTIQRYLTGNHLSAAGAVQQRRPGEPGSCRSEPGSPGRSELP